MKQTLTAMLLLLMFEGCALKNQADAKFGDQHYKTVVALIELHKLRHQEYPSSLSDLAFLGQWDSIALAAVEYRRLAEGYELNLVRGWVGKPTLDYPASFWRGLGIRATNVGGCPQCAPSDLNPPTDAADSGGQHSESPPHRAP